MTPTPSAKNNRLLTLYQSSVGKKLITGTTGLALVTFVIMHMIGNLVFLVSPDGYNQYGYFIERLGPLLWLIELGLLAFVVLHSFIGVNIFLRRRQARTQGYNTYTSAGAPSYQTFSSRTMILTGLVLGSFLIWHLITFKFGIRYTVPGTDMRDLSRLLLEKFHQPVYAFSYAGIMLLLASHLRHGIWSALQSLGVLNATLRPAAYTLSLVFGVGLGLGFVVLPLVIYFGLV